MNILFTTFQGDVAGSTNSMFYLSTSFADRGHNVYMACRVESLIYKMLEETQVKSIPMKFKTKFDLKAARKIKDLVNEHGIEIINSQSGKDRYTVIWAKLLLGLRTPHINTRRQKPRSDGGWLINKFISINTSKIVAVSHSIKRALVKIGYPENHVVVIHNGTPRSKYGQQSSKQIDKLKTELGIDGTRSVIGSVSRRKNHDQLLRALKFLKVPVKLILVGIEENAEYADIIGGYDVPHEVHFLGTVSNEDALHYLRIFDVNVLPSIIEGISQSILEAMASGIPVVATNASGNPEIITDGENGFLFEDGNMEELASKIYAILSDHALRKRFIENGLKTAFEQFSMQTTVNNYETLFEDLVKKVDL